MRTVISISALVLSILSLGFQAAKSKSAPIYEKFFAPADISDFDYRVLRIDEALTRNSIEMSNGISVPFVRELSKDHNRVTVRVLVAEKSLPQAFEARKSALLGTAYLATAAVENEFDLKPDQVGAVAVQFMSVEQLAKSSDNGKPYAEFANGELTFH